jgi:hypothetical protein
MNTEQLRHGAAVWVPSQLGWIPATVMAHDESESFPVPGNSPQRASLVMVEVRFDQATGRNQFQKVDSRHLRPRDPTLKGRDEPSPSDAVVSTC